MNSEEAKSKLEETCKECKKLKQEHSKLKPILESESQKMRELEHEQLGLKKDYVKFLINDNFIGYDKSNSIHYCYIGCEHNIARRE